MGAVQVILDLIYDPSRISNAIADWFAGFAPDWVVYIIVAIIGMIAFLGFLLVALLFVMYWERKLIGHFQIRYGPNRAGPLGLLQSVADAIKILTKEDFTPSRVDRLVFRLAPVVALIPGIMVFAVFPFGERMAYVDLNVGLLYIVAILSLTTIAIFMAGWSSNNKFSLLAAMRTIAMTISYEIPMLLALIGVLMVVGSLSMTKVVQAQTVPFMLMQPLGFILYFISALTELNRSPMDIMEAESEIVAGYHTEYSGFSFSVFYLAEYTDALAIAAITTTVFLGGWKPSIFAPWAWFIVKMFLVFSSLVWLRATMPRMRIDQLMSFAWKFMLPLALINILVIGVELTVWPAFPWWLFIVNIVLAAALIVGWTNVYKKGARAELQLDIQEQLRKQQLDVQGQLQKEQPEKVPA